MATATGTAMWPTSCGSGRPSSPARSWLETPPPADPVPGPPHVGIAAAVGELGGQADVPQGEERGKRRDHRRHDSHRPERGHGDEEDVEDHRADHPYPKRHTQAPDHSHE